MTAHAATATATSTPTRRRTGILWTLQVLLALMFIVASAAPKFAGEAYAVQIFEQIGAGQWFRYVVGALELAGGVGLLVPRLAGLAALGLVGLMIGAGYTQVVVLQNPVFVITPIILGVLAAVVAWGRRDSVARLLGH
jgi:putative oxidoreductase